MIKDNDRQNGDRRAVEARAQALYEAEDPAGVAWAKRAQIVREPWLRRAERELGVEDRPNNAARSARG